MITTLYAPCVVGVPETAPLAAMVTPGGSVVPGSVNVYGEVPPVAVALKPEIA